MKKKKPDYQIAGKTGTSTNFVDAWFVGYTPDLVTAVWLGNNKGAITLGKGRTGGGLAAPVWGRFISESYHNTEPVDFVIPSTGISYQTIELSTGKVPLNENNIENIAKDELFYSGTEPGEYADPPTE